MSTMNQQNCNSSSSSYGGDVNSRVNVLASCYVVDSLAQLKGLHYCTTGVTGMHIPFFNRTQAHSNTDSLLGAEWYS